MMDFVSLQIIWCTENWSGHKENIKSFNHFNINTVTLFPPSPFFMMTDTPTVRYPRNTTKAVSSQTWNFTSYNVNPCTRHEVEDPRFLDNRHIRWQGCQPYAPTPFTSQEIFPLLINSLENESTPMTLRGRKDYVNEKFQLGIEPTTFRLVAQRLNQLRYRVTWVTVYFTQIRSLCYDEFTENVNNNNNKYTRIHLYL